MGSSSTSGHWEVHYLIRDQDEARGQHFDARREVGRLELCLDAVQTALDASERDTAATRATMADAQAKAIGRVPFAEGIYPCVHDLCFDSVSVVRLGVGVGRSSRGSPRRGEGHEPWGSFA